MLVPYGYQATSLKALEPLNRVAFKLYRPILHIGDLQANLYM